MMMMMRLVVPVFPSLLYNSAVHSSTSVPFLDSKKFFVGSALLGDSKIKLTVMVTVRCDVFLESLKPCW